MPPQISAQKIVIASEAKQSPLRLVVSPIRHSRLRAKSRLDPGSESGATNDRQYPAFRAGRSQCANDTILVTRDTARGSGDSASRRGTASLKVSKQRLMRFIPRRGIHRHPTRFVSNSVTHFPPMAIGDDASTWAHPPPPHPEGPASCRSCVVPIDRQDAGPTMQMPQHI